MGHDLTWSWHVDLFWWKVNFHWKWSVLQDIENKGGLLSFASIYIIKQKHQPLRLVSPYLDSNQHSVHLEKWWPRTLKLVAKYASALCHLLQVVICICTTSGSHLHLHYFRQSSTSALLLMVACICNTSGKCHSLLTRNFFVFHFP